MKNENEIIRIKNYEDFIQQASMAINSLDQDKTAAVMYIDVTGFQLVNDFYGFAEGDRFLDALCVFLEKLPYTKVCGRVFSDHYLRLAVMDKGTDIKLLIQASCQCMDEFLEEQYQYHLNCKLKLCCGYCLVENGEKGLIKAIDDANLARKEKKSSTQSTINLFDNVMRRRIKERKDMEVSIQSALRQQEFIFYLQPKVSLNTGKVVGAEALARWIKAEGAMVFPDSFIPLMESNGTIIELDFLIYRKVCEYLSERLRTGKQVIPISVNISRVHIYQNNFVQNLHEMAVSHGIPPYLLEFELTENILLEEFDNAKQVMDSLRAYGYKVSIDDFGSGFTGVNIWKQLDFDVLKLDKSYISENSEEMKRNDTIITSITYVGKKRQTALLCEGTETREQCRHMKEMGCEIAQGYYFSPPVSVEDFHHILEKNNGYYSIFWADSEEKMGAVQSVEEWKRLQLDSFYREIYDLADCAIIQYKEMEDKKRYHCISLNRYAVELYGFNNKEEALNEKTDIVKDFILEEDILANVDKIASLRQPGDSVVMDFRIRTKLGMLRQITGTLKIMLNQNGDKVYLGVLVDKSKQQELNALKEQLNMVVENTPGDIIILTLDDESFETQYLTTGLARVFGYEKTEFRKMLDNNNGLQLIYEEDGNHLINTAKRIARHREPLNLNFRVMYKSGEIGWHNLSADYAYDTDQGQRVYHGIITDITKLKKQEEALMVSERHYHAAAAILKADIWSYSFELDRMELPVAEELSDLDLGGKTVVALKEFIEGGHIHPDYIDSYLSMYKKITEGEKESETELLAKTKKGGYQWFHIQFRALTYEDNRPLEMVGVAKNINEEKLWGERYEKLQEKARLDNLTGFCNRETAVQLIQDRLGAMGKDEKAAFFLFDLDNFKMINDNFGHLEGDNVLQMICKKVQRNMPKECILGRLGGDEFILYVPDISTKDGVIKIAQMICHIASRSFYDKGREITLSVSIGIVLAGTGIEFTELYKRADEAMYQVKSRNKNGYHIWEME